MYGREEATSLTVSKTWCGMSWGGPNKIGDFLNGLARSPWKRPPEKAGVYGISEKPWTEGAHHGGWGALRWPGGLPAIPDRAIVVRPAQLYR